MNGHFPTEISKKDQCEVFTNDLNKDISNKMSMFAADIQLLPEGMYWRDLRSLGRGANTATLLAAQSLKSPSPRQLSPAFGPIHQYQGALKTSGPTSWASAQRPPWAPALEPEST